MPSKQGVTVSLCMIVKNEEKNLDACLSPIADLFDEIIIIDTGSQDSTKEIAGRYTSHVYDFPWCDNFAAARNKSLQHATSDWIFWLDADDRITTSELPNLRALLSELSVERKVYMINTVCHFQYESDGTHFLTHARLFPRTTELMWKGRVHEQLHPCPTKLGYKFVYPPLKIDHLGYSDITQRQKKLHRDIRLLRIDYAMDPEDPSTLFHLSLAHGRAGNHVEAKKHLQMLYKMQFPVSDWQRRVYDLLVGYALKEGDFQSALKYAKEGLSLFPNDIPLLYQKAHIFYCVNDYLQCLNVLEYITKNDLKQDYHGGEGNVRETEVPWLQIETLRQLHRLEEAEIIAKYVANNPGHLRAYWSLGTILLALNKRDELSSIREKIECNPEGRVFSKILRVEELLQFNELEEVESLLEEIISLAPNMPHPRLLRLQYLHKIDASIDSYLAACRDVLRVYPQHIAVKQEMERLENYKQTAKMVVSTDFYQPIHVGV